MGSSGHLDMNATPGSGGAVGRLMRWDGQRWATIGDPLPAFEHAPPTPTLPFAPWVLPIELGAAAYDVVVVGEIAHQLMIRCAEDDEVFEQLANQSMMFFELHEVMRWLTEVEVWMGRRLDPAQPWSPPPA